MVAREVRLSHWLVGHVRSWRDSGLTRADYCRAHGLARKSFDYWVRRSREAGEPAPPTMTLVAARRAVPVTPNIAAQSLTLKSPEGWLLSFDALRPAGWLRALLSEAGAP